MKKILWRVFVAILMAQTGICAMAQDSDVPEISMYYPGKNDSSPSELRRNATAWVYFKAPAHIVSVKAELIQDGKSLGDITFAGSKDTWGNWNSRASMNPALEGNEAMSLVGFGQFTFNFFEVTYIAEEDAEKCHSDRENLLGSVTYRRQPEGYLVSESGLEDGIIRSYYPADAEDGVYSYTFSTALNPDRINAYLEYGSANNVFYCNVPFTLDDTNTIVTVDLRGALHNPEALTGGFTFTDDEGNIFVPTNINLILNNLTTSTGGLVTSTSIVPNTGKEFTLTGQVFRSFTLKDITFPTPVLSKVLFRNSAEAGNTSNTIKADSDTFDIYIANMQYIATADILMQAGDVEASIAYDSITKAEDCFTALLPEAIRKEGSDNLVISLVNVAYSTDDGATHNIKPLNLAGQAKEIESLAALKTLAPGAKAVLNVESGLKVTMSNEQGYCFMEDETGGIQVTTADYSQPFQASTQLIGQIAGTVYEGNVFEVDIAESSFTAVPANVMAGHIVVKLDDLQTADYNGCLMSFVAQNYAIEYDAELETIIIFAGNREDALLCELAFIAEDYEYPAKITDITGILYEMPGIGYALIPRYEEDINQGIELPEVGVENIIVPEKAVGAFDLMGRRVVWPTNAPGIYIIDGKKVVVK